MTSERKDETDEQLPVYPQVSSMTGPQEDLEEDYWMLQDFLRGWSLVLGRKRETGDSWHVGRFIGFVTLILIEVAMTDATHGDEVLLARPLDDMRDQIFPDMEENFERMDQGMGHMGHMAELLNANNIMKHVSWFQTFCASGGGDHLDASWLCLIKTLEVIGPADPALQGQPGMNCSREWITKHVVMGDPTDDVPLGSMPSDTKIDEGFDEYPFKQQSDFWAGAKEATLEALEEDRETQQEQNGTSLAQISADDNDKFSQQSAARHFSRHSRAHRREHFYSSLMREVQQEGEGDRYNMRRTHEAPSPTTTGFDGPLCQDPMARKTMMTCKNHHWGPLFRLCRPERVRVVFHIENRYAGRFWANFPNNGLIHVPASLKNASDAMDGRFWDFSMIFTRVGEPTYGWYRTEIRTTTGSRDCRVGKPAVFIAILAICMSSAIMLDGLFSCLKLPSTIFRLALLRSKGQDASDDDIWKEINAHADPVGWHEASGPQERFLFEGYLENLIGLHWLVSRTFSLYLAYTDYNQIVWGKDGLPVADPLDKSRWEKATMFQACAGSFPMEDIIVQGAWLFGGCTQEVLLALLVIRMNFCFRKIPHLGWWPAVIVQCGAKIIQFMFFFILMLVAFAAMMFVRFGAVNQMFFTLYRSWQTLVLYCFGLADPLEGHHLHPYENEMSLSILRMFTLFQILVVTIAINFFLAIIMNAYDVVAEDENNLEAKMVSQLDNYGRFFIRLICPYHQVSKTLRDSATDEEPPK